MDAAGARKFRVSMRVSSGFVALGLLLVGSAVWNFQLYRRAERQRARAIAAERAESARQAEQATQEVVNEKARLSQAAEENEQARLLARRQAERVKDLARVKQLYQELNTLSHLNERILVENQNVRVAPRRNVQPDE